MYRRRATEQHVEQEESEGLVDDGEKPSSSLVVQALGVDEVALAGPPSAVLYALATSPPRGLALAEAEAVLAGPPAEPPSLEPSSKAGAKLPGSVVTGVDCGPAAAGRREVGGRSSSSASPPPAAVAWSADASPTSLTPATTTLVPRRGNPGKTDDKSTSSMKEDGVGSRIKEQEGELDALVGTRYSTDQDHDLDALDGPVELVAWLGGRPSNCPLRALSAT